MKSQDGAKRKKKSFSPFDVWYDFVAIQRYHRKDGTHTMGIVYSTYSSLAFTYISYFYFKRAKAYSRVSNEQRKLAVGSHSDKTTGWIGGAADIRILSRHDGIDGIDGNFLPPLNKQWFKTGSNVFWRRRIIIFGFFAVISGKSSLFRPKRIRGFLPSFLRITDFATENKTTTRRTLMANIAIECAVGRWLDQDYP